MVSVFQGLGLAAAGAAEQFELVKKIEADENQQLRRERQAKLGRKMNTEEWYKRKEYDEKRETIKRKRENDEEYAKNFSMVTSLAGGDQVVKDRLNDFGRVEIANILDMYSEKKNDISFADYIMLGAKKNDDGSFYFDASTVSSQVNSAQFSANPDVAIGEIDYKIEQISLANPNSSSLKMLENLRTTYKGISDKNREKEALDAAPDDYTQTNQAIKIVRGVKTQVWTRIFPTAKITAEGEVLSNLAPSLRELAQDSQSGNMPANKLKLNLKAALKLTRASTTTFNEGKQIRLYTDTTEKNQVRTEAFVNEINRYGVAGTTQLLGLANTALQMLKHKGNQTAGDGDASTARNTVLNTTLTAIKNQFSAVNKKTGKPLAVVVNLQELVKTSNDFKNTSGFGESLVSRATPINYYTRKNGELTTITVGEMMDIYNNTSTRQTQLVLQ